ncbi:MAG: hypothetical protein HUJ80_07695 [Firmicutes bacterium]|nr:hypothetical protein [Bacillota bacterium]
MATCITGLIKAVKGKAASKRGVTLAELLCTVVLFSFASAAMLTGIRFGAAKYSTIMKESSAKVLYTSLYSAISDELRYTSVVVLGESSPCGHVVESFYSSSFNGKRSTSFQQLDEEGNAACGYGRIGIGGHSLLPDGAYTRGLLAKVESLYYDPGEEIFTVSLSIGTDEESILTQSFQVMNLNHASQL